MFSLGLVCAGCCTTPHRLHGCRTSERRTGEDISIIPEMTWRKVNVAIKEVRVEVVGDLLYYLFE